MELIEQYGLFCDTFVNSDVFLELVARNNVLNVDYTEIFVDVDEGTELYDAGVRKIFIEYNNNSCKIVTTVNYVDTKYLLSPITYSYHIVSADYDLKSGERLQLSNGSGEADFHFDGDVDMSKYTSYAPIIINSKSAFDTLLKYKVSNVDKLTFKLFNYIDAFLVDAQTDLYKILSNSGEVCLDISDYLYQTKYAVSLGKLLNLGNEISLEKKGYRYKVSLITGIMYADFLSMYQMSFIEDFFHSYDTIEMIDKVLTKEEFESVYHSLD
jgi:hypothetical protein